jgi:hypothetical protein
MGQASTLDNDCLISLEITRLSSFKRLISWHTFIALFTLNRLPVHRLGTSLLSRTV